MNSHRTADLDQYIEQVKNLPPAPALLPELLGLLSEPNVDNARIVRLITYDPALTTNVLRLCNSAVLASATPVISVEEAVVRLGFEQVYRLVAAVSVAPMLRPVEKSDHAAPNLLWEHSVTTAVAAQLIARDLGVDRNLVFTAALLHDVGKIILLGALGEVYAKLVDEVERNQQSLLEAEKRTLGVEHAELGGRLLARWNFPLNLTAAVWFHHHPAAAVPYQRLAALIYFGNLIAYLVGHGFGHQVLALRGRAEALEILEFDGDSLPGYMMETYAEFDAIRGLFRAAL